MRRHDYERPKSAPCSPPTPGGLLPAWQVGGAEGPQADVARLHAIRRGHPSCGLLVDANEGYEAGEAVEVVHRLCAEGLRPLLLEQPVARADWEGLRRVTEEAGRRGVPVAADESCRSVGDARRIATEGLAPVLNIKLAKCGVAGALDIMQVLGRSGADIRTGAHMYIT